MERSMGARLTFTVQLDGLGRCSDMRHDVDEMQKLLKHSVGLVNRGDDLAVPAR
jgi:hypothetical protein